VHGQPLRSVVGSESSSICFSMAFYMLFESSQVGFWVPAVGPIDNSFRNTVSTCQFAVLFRWAYARYCVIWNTHSWNLFTLFPKLFNANHHSTSSTKKTQGVGTAGRLVLGTSDSGVTIRSSAGVQLLARRKIASFLVLLLRSHSHFPTYSFIFGIFTIFF
jgi:hypothetical protein